MKLYELSTPVLLRQLVRCLSGIDGLGTERVLLENPGISASFPCIVVSESLFRQKKGGTWYDLSVKVEAWAKSQYEAMELSDRARVKLRELNYLPANPTPALYDNLTAKHRAGAYYECRWNAVTNTLEMNR